MKYINSLCVIVMLLCITGCSKAEEEKVISAHSARKAQYLYLWSGSKKDDVMLVKSAVKHYFANYEEAYNKDNMKLFKSTVKAGSPAEEQIAADIKAGTHRNMVLYSNSIDHIRQVDNQYIAKVGQEVSNDSVGGRTYSETEFHFEYDPSLKQMMISEFSDVNNSEIKVKDKDSAQEEAKGSGVQIDVLGSEFKTQYLTDGSRYFGGVADNMSYQVLKDRYGDFTDHFSIKGNKYYVFGNAAVQFNNEITEKSNGTESVTDMVIMPSYTLYQDVIAFYGQPDKEKLENTNSPQVSYVDESGNHEIVFHLSTNKKEVDYVEKVR